MQRWANSRKLLPSLACGNKESLETRVSRAQEWDHQWAWWAGAGTTAMQDLQRNRRPLDSLCFYQSISQYLPSANPEGSQLVGSFPNNSLWSTPYLFPKVRIAYANFWQQAQAHPFHQVCLTIYKFKWKLQWKGRHLFLVTSTKNNCLASSLRTESCLRDGYQGTDLSAKEQVHLP